MCIFANHPENKTGFLVEFCKLSCCINCFLCYINRMMKNEPEVLNMKTDIEIANEYKPLNIRDIAVSRLGLAEDELDFYGKYKAKVNPGSIKSSKQGELILVTAINPTKYGEGKTTVSIGLADALNKLGKNAVLALREPSLGPVFGIKGGAAGGGYSQVVPMEDINLHFTGDFHAITSANNLLCAMIDNHIFQGNALQIDPATITFKRCLDMNDRALRDAEVAAPNTRTDHFEITAASEIMAIFCLSRDMEDLKKNLGDITVAKTVDGKPVTARDLHADGAMTVLLKDAFAPNLVQTLEGNPAFVHGGPFANIAHGCNSITATAVALKLGDYVVTEAGFGSDLGAEKFLDIKCRRTGLKPGCIVLVATIRALKVHGVAADPKAEDAGAVSKGFCNLLRHYRNLTEKFGCKVVVALNKFYFDTDAELAAFDEKCKEYGIDYALSNGFVNGGAGCVELAEKVMQKCDASTLNFTYADNDPVLEKIRKVCVNIYGARDIECSDEVRNKALEYTEKYPDYPICIAKTQYSFSADAKLIGAPEDFTIKVTDMAVRSGAKFIVVYLNNVMTMPGLPKVPNAERIDLIDGKIVNLS